MLPTFTWTGMFLLREVFQTIHSHENRNVLTEVSETSLAVRCLPTASMVVELVLSICKVFFVFFSKGKKEVNVFSELGW